MGRTKRATNTAKEVNSFDVDKQTQLEVFTKKKTSLLSKELMAKFDIKPVGLVSGLHGNCLYNFTEGNYEASLEKAYSWRDDYNNWKDPKTKIGNPKKIKLVDYYPQIAFGSSIIVSYNLV